MPTSNPTIQRPVSPSDGPPAGPSAGSSDGRPVSRPDTRRSSAFGVSESVPHSEPESRTAPAETPEPPSARLNQPASSRRSSTDGPRLPLAIGALIAVGAVGRLALLPLALLSSGAPDPSPTNATHAARPPVPSVRSMHADADTSTGQTKGDSTGQFTGHPTGQTINQAEARSTARPSITRFLTTREAMPAVHEATSGVHGAITDTDELWHRPHGTSVRQPQRIIFINQNRFRGGDHDPSQRCGDARGLAAWPIACDPATPTGWPVAIEADAG